MKQKLLGNLKEGLLFVVSAPSGAGKATLVKMLCDEFDSVVKSVTCTTRKPRQGEIPDRDYHFVTREEFEKKKAAGAFLGWAQVFEDLYGTLKADVGALQKSGKHVILVIDTQGALQVLEKTPAVLIFIAPPSLEEL